MCFHQFKNWLPSQGINCMLRKKRALEPEIEKILELPKG